MKLQRKGFELAAQPSESYAPAQPGVSAPITQAERRLHAEWWSRRMFHKNTIVERNEGVAAIMDGAHDTFIIQRRFIPGFLSQDQPGFQNSTHEARYKAALLEFGQKTGLLTPRGHRTPLMDNLYDFTLLRVREDRDGATRNEEDVLF